MKREVRRRITADAPSWIAREARVLFFVFGPLIAARGIYMVVLPSADPDHWRSYTSGAHVVAVGALLGTYGRFFRRTTAP